MLKLRKWIMLVALADQRQIAFYQSDDLKSWTQSSTFGPLGDVDAVWECPDLFELALDSTEKTYWILSVSAGSYHEGHLGMQYFIGQFDGNTFQIMEAPYPLYLDYGKDFYAGITYNNLPTKKYALMIGWMNNHHYAKDTPSSPWRGTMSIPRQLYLQDTKHGIRLFQKIADQFDEAFQSIFLQTSFHLAANKDFSLALRRNSFKLELAFKQFNAGTLRLQLFANNSEDFSILFKPDQIQLDRSKAGTVSFNPLFNTCDHLVFSNSSLKDVQIIADQSTLEIFLNQGEMAMSYILFPGKEATEIRIQSMDHSILFEKIHLASFK